MCQVKDDKESFEEMKVQKNKECNVLSVRNLNFIQ